MVQTHYRPPYKTMNHRLAAAPLQLRHESLPTIIKNVSRRWHASSNRPPWVDDAYTTAEEEETGMVIRYSHAMRFLCSQYCREAP